MTKTFTDIVRGYAIVAEMCNDPGDPQRGEWLDVWVTTPDGLHSNSLACLEGEGRFDDGPEISERTLDEITAWAKRRGY